MSSGLEVDEFLPPSDSLVAVQFRTLDEFRRGRALLSGQPDCFVWLDEPSLVIVVRKEDQSIFASAGLQYSERPVVDGPGNPSAADAEDMRRWMREMNTRMLKGLSLEQ